MKELGLDMVTGLSTMSGMECVSSCTTIGIMV